MITKGKKLPQNFSATHDFAILRPTPKGEFSNLALEK